MAVFKTRNFLFIIFFIAVGVSSIYLFLDNKIKSVERANLENNLSRMIEMQKHGEIKFIDFSNIATFSWDKLYILGPYVILEKVPLKNHWLNSSPTSIEYRDGFVLLVFRTRKMSFNIWNTKEERVIFQTQATFKAMIDTTRCSLLITKTDVSQLVKS